MILLLESDDALLLEDDTAVLLEQPDEETPEPREVIYDWFESAINLTR